MGRAELIRTWPPQTIRTFSSTFLAPYQLVLQGYIVVTTDYAGLGVAKDTSGEPIMDEYLASPSQANDMVQEVVRHGLLLREKSHVRRQDTSVLIIQASAT